MDTRSFLLSSLIAGVVIGLLGNLPLLNLVNCLLCVWVWLGGVLAVYLYRRFQGGQPGLSQAQAAGLGALAGLIGALVGSLVFLVTGSLSAPLFESLARALQIEGDLPFGADGSWGPLWTALGFLVLDVVPYPIFGALGGLIGVSLFKPRPATA